jgi:ketosteroid isomerase-like protein
MAAEQRPGATEKIVDEYFNHIRDLRRGVEGSPEKLRDLWEEDGVFEFVGAPPVTGSFVGRNAIYVLYKNRFAANRMPLRLEGREPRRELIEARLGEVDTEVRRTKVLDGKVVAAWSTTVATEDSQGFQVAGSHTFTFRGERISHLKVVVSPRAEEAANLRLESLSVDDIGRLALAAWAVV